jgi:hypothetical protein
LGEAVIKDKDEEKAGLGLGLLKRKKTGILMKRLLSGM